MKKTYMKPVLSVEQINISVNILIGSNPVAGIDKSDAAGTTPDLFESHSNSGWDIWGSEEEYDDDYDY